MSRPVTGGGFIIPGSGKNRGTGIKGFQQMLRSSTDPAMREKAGEITALKKRLKDTIIQAGGGRFLDRSNIQRTPRQREHMARFIDAGKRMGAAYRAWLANRGIAGRPPKADRARLWDEFRTAYPVGTIRPSTYRTLGAAAAAEGAEMPAMPYTSLPAYGGATPFARQPNPDVRMEGTAFLGWNTPEWLNRAGQVVAPALNFIPGQPGQALRAAAAGELGTVGQAAQYAASRLL